MPVAKIADPFDLEHVMGIVREHANCLPESKDSLAHLLGMLIADALSEFTGEKFDMPRRSGDLDDADGINHLLSDYPSWIYPSGKRAAFLTVEEEAAALLLRKLYLARDFLELGFGLPEESIREIETESRTLLNWRLHGPAFVHDKERRLERTGGRKGGMNKAAKQAPKLTKRNEEIKRRARNMQSAYSESEILDFLQTKYPEIGRRQLANILSSTEEENSPRAKSSS